MNPRTKLLKLSFVLLIASTANTVFAQNQPPQKPAEVSPVTKFKPPVVKTVLGKSTGVGSTVTVEEGKDLIALPLKVLDEKTNVAYTITSYQFAFKRVGVKEDEETGATTPTTDMVSDRFTTTPLPEIWRKTIKETLIKGEEFYFFDIIVMDKQGHRFFAPELKIAIQ